MDGPIVTEVAEAGEDIEEEDEEQVVVAAVVVVVVVVVGYARDGPYVPGKLRRGIGRGCVCGRSRKRRS